MADRKTALGMLAAVLRTGSPRSLTVLLLAFVTSLQAHSLHQSIAEAEYNAQTKKLEVSLTVFINDLETALIRRAERDLRIERTPPAVFDAQVVAYLGAVLNLTDAAGRPAKLEWLGRQLDVETQKSSDPAATLFFQFTLPKGLAGTTLRHALFCELFADQVNLLLLKDGATKRSMRFISGDTAKPLHDKSEHVP